MWIIGKLSQLKDASRHILLKNHSLNYKVVYLNGNFFFGDSYRKECNKNIKGYVN